MAANELFTAITFLSHHSSPCLCLGALILVDLQEAAPSFHAFRRLFIFTRATERIKTGKDGLVLLTSLPGAP